MVPYVCALQESSGTGSFITYDSSLSVQTLGRVLSSRMNPHCLWCPVWTLVVCGGLRAHGNGFFHLV